MDYKKIFIHLIFMLISVIIAIYNPEPIFVSITIFIVLMEIFLFTTLISEMGILFNVVKTKRYINKTYNISFSIIGDDVIVVGTGKWYNFLFYEEIGSFCIPEINPYKFDTTVFILHLEGEYKKHKFKDEFKRNNFKDCYRKDDEVEIKRAEKLNKLKS